MPVRNWSHSYLTALVGSFWGHRVAKGTIKAFELPLPLTFWLFQPSLTILLARIKIMHATTPQQQLFWHQNSYPSHSATYVDYLPTQHTIISNPLRPYVLFLKPLDRYDSIILSHQVERLYFSYSFSQLKQSQIKSLSFCDFNVNNSNWLTYSSSVNNPCMSRCWGLCHCQWLDTGHIRAHKHSWSCRRQSRHNWSFPHI